MVDIKYKIIKILEENKSNIKKNKILIKCENCGDERKTSTYLFKKYKDCTCKVIEEIPKEKEDMLLIDYIPNRSSAKSRVKLLCKKCGIEKIISLIEFLNKKNLKHSFYCNQILFKELKERFGDKEISKFIRMYNNARTRILNKNYTKKKQNYSNMEFGYDDVYIFIKDYLFIYLDTLKNIKLNEITIDRIDNRKGYIKGNIQFISSFDNSGKKLIHQENIYNITYNGIKYKNISNLADFARKINFKKDRLWYIIKISKYKEKYGFVVEKCRD